ncbi:serine/arginine repetitive matrix protein 1 [Bicyclus anynana]|uniref:Serine/arginine repetitive matrix protein 1 n=1 Tax=Bicyclus anynana TaxID=110368 RepID=A0A6J1MSQ5_BICAN|nr:serine/arginine repetitive matrix protein 1 [Bicyclus anynana]
MHIQERTNTTLTTCTKMTEEVDRRHGVNGNSSKSVNEDPPPQSAAQAATGGRLKFFKDGKFILELVRGCAREGERAGWVSVPRKTFWPPAAAPPTPPHAAPPCASLSLSDDNSSLHSSPCASSRDHAWKQPAPRRHLARALAFCYVRPSSLRAAHTRRAARRKRRRPFDALDAPDADAPGDDAVDGPAPPPDDREKYYHMKLKKPYQYHKLRVYKKTKSPFRPKELARTIDRLREKAAALPVLVNAKLANCRQEHAMVSPRKRILREMERVSLEDQATKRRAKTVPALGTAPPAPSPGPSRARTPNGTQPKPAKHVSSYSIHSLLSMPDETREPEPKRSPHSSVTSPDLSPSPEHYRYRAAALARDSPRDSPTPPQPAPPAFRAYSSPASPYAARAWPAAAPAPAYARRDDWGAQYVYGYGYVPHVYRAPAPPLWMHYALAPGAPPGPWAPMPHPLLTDHIPKDEPTSDLPLNLSKH